MRGKTFWINRSEGWLERGDEQLDWLWGLGLLIAAVALFTINLGSLPLRDWDEGLVAQVAREISQAPHGSMTWLYPTLWGQPYLNKPTLIHNLIAVCYAIGGVNEWTARLPGALLTASSVPLFYGICREVFYPHLPAVFAALVYLTSLPVVRNGRLAMLDGAILCFLMLMLWCVLRARRDYRYALGIGIGLGLICLTKGVMVGLLLGSIALAFLAWDTPRLLKAPYLWLGILLGCAPVAGWYFAQWHRYGFTFLNANLVDQSFQRIWVDVERNKGPVWFYLLELLKYGAPWLLFLPTGLKLAWANRNLSWARLALIWAGIYLVAISLMATKLPWYILPLYPALALIVGIQLTELWKQGNGWLGAGGAAAKRYSPLWVLLFVLLGLVAWAGAGYFSWFSVPAETDLVLILAALGLTLTVVAVLIAQQSSQFLVVLIWGTYVSLMLLMISQHWVWELAEAYPVKPVAAIVQENAPDGQPVFTSYPYNRPSLNFYSMHPVIPIDPKQVGRFWKKTEYPYLLLDDITLAISKLDHKQVLGSAEGWTLVTKKLNHS